jgi:hypothetical protein
MSSDFTCTYCFKSPPDVRPSKSHTLPEALGKSSPLENVVCIHCNGAFNKRVEEKLIKKMAPIRNMLAIESKRGDIPAIKTTLSFMGQEVKTSCVKPGDLEKKMFVFEGIKGKDGKPGIAFIGDKDSVKKHMDEYKKKNPKFKFGDIDPKDMGDGVQAEVCLDMSLFFSEEAARLAAKIAYEWCCRKKGGDVMEGHEFKSVKEFIMNGTKGGHPTHAFITIDPLVLGGLDNIPFGIHSIYFSQTPDHRNLIVIVGLFGLIYYKVILTNNWTSLAAMQSLTIINPQAGEYEPSIVEQTNPPNIHALSKYDRKPTVDELKTLTRAMLKKMNNGYAELLKQQHSSSHD